MVVVPPPGEPVALVVLHRPGPATTHGRRPRLQWSSCWLRPGDPSIGRVPGPSLWRLVRGLLLRDELFRRRAADDYTYTDWLYRGPPPRAL